jgi:hypothetical protein
MINREDPSSFNLIFQENLILTSNTQITTISKSIQFEISNSNKQFQRSDEEGKFTKQDQNPTSTIYEKGEFTT